MRKFSEFLAESSEPNSSMSVRMACDLIIAKVNELIPKADDINNRINIIRDAARNNLFSWAKALTGEDIVKQLNDIHTQRFKVEEKKKYINLDIGGSGKFMVSKVAGAPMEHSVPGDIYGIKGYGVIHTGHRYGNIYQISAIDFLKAANVARLSPKAIDMAARGEKGPDVSHINPVATQPQPEPQHVTTARKNNVIPFPKRF